MENFNSPPAECLGDVAPGTVWRPEPAARYNAVNDLLRNAGGFFAAPPQSNAGMAGVITGFCVSSDIALFDVVMIMEPKSIQFEVTAEDRICAVARGNSQNIDPWGIAQCDIPADDAGPVLMCGVTPVHGVLGIPKSHIIPASEGYGKLRYADFGRAEVLWHDNDGNAVILLGGGGSVDTAYHGEFSVSVNGDGNCTIKGGDTDVSDYPVPDTVMPMQNGTLSLYARWVDPRYEYKFGYDLPAGWSGNYGYFRIADISYSPENPPGKAKQIWTNGAIYFGTRYCV